MTRPALYFIFYLLIFAGLALIVYGINEEERE